MELYMPIGPFSLWHTFALPSELLKRRSSTRGSKRQRKGMSGKQDIATAQMENKLHSTPVSFGHDCHGVDSSFMSCDLGRSSNGP